MAVPQVQIDPTAPPGSQPLQLGPPDFRNIEVAILELFQLPTGALTNFGAPFHFANLLQQASGLVSLNDDPIDPLGAVTKRYVDQKLIVATITSGDGMHYTGTPVPALVAGVVNVLYLLLSSTTNAAGGVTLALGTAIGPLVRADGTMLAAGDIVAGEYFLATFDGTSFRLINFIGGTLSQNLILAAAQATLLNGGATANLAAATKQYVDATILRPVRVPMPVQKAFGPNAVLWDTSGASPALKTPNDGNSYLVHGEYVVYANITPGAADRTLVWLDDGTNQWAVSGQGTYDANNAPFCFTGAGYSPTIFPPNTPITINVRGQALGTGNAVPTPSLTVAPPLPSSYLTVTMERTTT